MTDSSFFSFSSLEKYQWQCFSGVRRVRRLAVNCHLAAQKMACPRVASTCTCKTEPRAEQWWGRAMQHSHVRRSRRFRVNLSKYRKSHFGTVRWTQEHPDLYSQFYIIQNIWLLSYDFCSRVGPTQGNYATQDSSGMCHLMPWRHLP